MEHSRFTTMRSFAGTLSAFWAASEALIPEEVPMDELSFSRLTRRLVLGGSAGGSSAGNWGGEGIASH
jgi:hypothetical protein